MAQHTRTLAEFTSSKHGPHKAQNPHSRSNPTTPRVRSLSTYITNQPPLLFLFLLSSATPPLSEPQEQQLRPGEELARRRP
jgi:hypothetical protein